MSLSLLQRDAAVVWHPFTQHKTVMPFLPIVKALGTYLYDENGNKYIDAISSWWTNLHGHSHPKIAEAIYNQACTLEHVMFAGITHEPAVQLAENLLAILPNNFKKIFYSDDGSTAVEVAIKMAIQYWENKNITQRKKILAFKGSYHGDSFGAMSVSDRGAFTLPFAQYMFDVIYIETPNEKNILYLEKLIETHKDELAFFIYEPLVQGAGGMHIYDAKYLNLLLQYVKKTKALTIADEVMTGFGRTGTAFASNYMQEKPDIICLSKGITGGALPLAVTACEQNIYDAFYENDILKTFFHGHSYTANPIACAAALASLNLLLQGDTESKLNFLKNAHLQFVQKNKHNKNMLNLRCLGTILAFEISNNQHNYVNKIKEETIEYGLKAGIFLRPLGNTVYIMPPYCIDATELEKVYTFLEEIAAKNLVV
jgi:adenosylmethionine---8-amino-7-oxononanoate aminotransferase